MNFVVSPTTYFVNHVMVAAGDRVTGYYDGSAPVPLEGWTIQRSVK
ncbi:hypothetical protein [Paenisporosarcina sp. TG-14]|nr:hypothetical protein [Paenisporosarcina sp. TG-14]